MGEPAHRPARQWLETIQIEEGIYFVLTRSFDKI